VEGVKVFGSALELIESARATGATIVLDRATGRLVVSGLGNPDLAAAIEARHDDIRSLFEEHDPEVGSVSDCIAAAVALVSRDKSRKRRARGSPEVPLATFAK
jgi:hypothetical protein